MIKQLALAVVLGVGSYSVSPAQSYYDDDIYYSASKAKKEKEEAAKKQAEAVRKQAEAKAAANYVANKSIDFPAADTYTITSQGLERDVDEYNRRTVSNYKSPDVKTDAGDFSYTRRIEKFHNPSIVDDSNDETLQYLYYTSEAEREQREDLTQVNVYINSPWGWNYTWPYYSSYAWGPSWYWNSWYTPGWSFAWNYIPGWTWGYAPSWGWNVGWGPSWGWAGPHGWGNPLPPAPGRPGMGVNRNPGNRRPASVAQSLPSRRPATGVQSPAQRQGTAVRQSGTSRRPATGVQMPSQSSSERRETILRSTTMNGNRQGTSSNRRGTGVTTSPSGSNRNSAARPSTGSGSSSRYGSGSSTSRRSSGSSYGSGSSNRSTGSSGTGRSSGGGKGGRH